MLCEITFEDKETGLKVYILGPRLYGLRRMMGSYIPISTYFKAHLLFRAFVVLLKYTRLGWHFNKTLTSVSPKGKSSLQIPLSDSTLSKRVWKIPTFRGK